MGVTFAAPAWLLLLPLALLLIVGLHIAARRRVGPWRRRLSVAIRVAVVGSLVFALAGFQLILPVDRLATVFVVDMSDSVGEPGRESAAAFIRESLLEKPDGDLAGIVAFGKGALVERLPSDLASLERLASTPVRSATDIGAALRLASALFPDDSQKRIVLLSDGNDTTGHGQTEAAIAGTRGIQVETMLIGPGARDEVVVERLTTPSIARLGEEIEAIAEIRSTVAQTASVRLFVDGAQVASELVDLDVGINRVVFRVEPSEPGFHTFRVVVDAPRDTFTQNDRADSNTIVKGEPRTLVVSGNDTVAAELIAALETERQLVDELPPEGLPADLAGLASYDSIVLVDVPRERLTDRQLASLQVYVRDLGRGLVAIGGPDAFGAGGYTKTPLEETLPVDMGVRDREKQPDVALVVVIDKSGSMDACHCNTFGGGGGGGTGIGGMRKVDIGKEAILRAAAAMTARDELGVVAFDEKAHWVVQTQPLGGIADLQGAVAPIQPEGQTNIFAGLDQAVQSLEKASATRRHIILLTDGWSSTGQYADILKRMAAAGITLSTVGAGGGSNPFLEGLARDGGGRFYNALNPGSIPDIFLKETQQVAGQQIVEEPFHPIQTGSSPILRGLDEGFPQLLGYNGTTAKPAAQTVLVTARDDPLLAQWQYGLGRSVAWTSDSTGRWAASWVGWDGFSRFFSQLVAWTFPGEEAGGIEAEFVTEGNRTELRVESVESDGSPRDFYSTRAVIVGPDLLPRDVGLVQTAPGVYQAALGEIDPGAYAIRITQTRSGTSSLGRTLGLVAPTSTEYRILGPNEALMAVVRSATGGRAITLPTEPWIHDLETTSSFTDLWPALLVLALLLWPLDVALRRVSVGRRELADARAWVGRVRLRRGAAAPRSVEAQGMLSARERAGGESVRGALRKDATGVAGLQGPAGPAPAAPGSAAPGPTPQRTAARPVPAPVPPTKAQESTARSPSKPASPESGPSAPETGEASDTIARLREAKKRARGR